eukprot:TRINITY_DN14371_c1_g2_i1.p1 TRINITY_DN14371_c1_g2~~TRINITY_DN14371_c1_g2_i1.p1  ORF type:complete len:281 (-),score=33.41 TRINITY_DN14371_c1_g2_i1:532-1374(-)
MLAQARAHQIISPLGDSASDSGSDVQITAGPKVEGVAHVSTQVGPPRDRSDVSRREAFSTQYVSLNDDDEESDDWSDSSSPRDSPAACSSSGSSLVGGLFLPLDPFDGLQEDAESNSFLPSPLSSSDEQTDDALPLVEMLLNMNQSYRRLGLSAPIIDEKRSQMERTLDLMNRADNAAHCTRALLNLQCLKAALPVDVRRRIATCFPDPPPPPDDGHGASSDEEFVTPQRTYCVDLDLRERIWPKSFLGRTSRRNETLAEWTEAQWRRVHHEVVPRNPSH